MLFLFHKILYMDSILKVDLDGIIENIKCYRKELKSNQKFCAVIKADCYGLGAKKISVMINDYVDYFAVASRKEFFSINRFVTKPIILLDPIYKNINILAKQNCEFCVSNVFQLKKFSSLAKRNKNLVYKIHLAVNTGMNRFGISSKCEIVEILDILQKTQNIIIKGVFSHFLLGNNKIIAKNQIKRFKDINKFLSSKIDIDNIIFHIANTSGFDLSKSFDMVRIGFGMFSKHNNQTFSLTSKIIEIQQVNKGESVGYGANFVADKFMKVAIVSIGYADGFSRAVSGKGFVLINGCFAKVLAVCMDSMIVDVSEIEVNLCDEVVVIGKSGDKQIFICDIASWCDTIKYEIMTRFSRRIKRVYIGGNISANHYRKI